MYTIYYVYANGTILVGCSTNGYFYHEFNCVPKNNLDALASFLGYLKEQEWELTVLEAFNACKDADWACECIENGQLNDKGERMRELVGASAEHKGKDMARRVFSDTDDDNLYEISSAIRYMRHSDRERLRARDASFALFMKDREYSDESNSDKEQSDAARNEHEEEYVPTFVGPCYDN